MIKFLRKNWFSFTVLTAIVISIVLKRININIVLSEGMVGLIGGLIGVYSGFLLSIIHNNRKEKAVRYKQFKALINELIYNNGLLEDSTDYEEFSELKTVFFEQAYTLALFVGLPSDLQEEIYSAYKEINLLKQKVPDSRYDFDRGELRSKIRCIIKKVNLYLKK